MTFLFMLLLTIGGGDTTMNTDHIYWLGHASFRIEDSTRQIYIDPWKLSDSTPKADIVLITHAHYDHYSAEDIEKIRKPTTVFVAPKDVADKIVGKVIVAEPGKKYQVEGLEVEAVPAYNIGKKFHPKENKWVGYVITLTNGQRIYHTGDTDAIPEMKQLSVDVALMPCGGTYTMTAEEVAEVANSFMPKVLIPMHWGDIVGAEKDAETVQKLFKGTTVIKKVVR